MNNLKILFRIHAVQRMFEREISAKKVRQALETGETIEDTHPKCLSRAA